MIDEKLSDEAVGIARQICDLEERLAHEKFGCSYDELCYENRGFVTMEAEELYFGGRV